MVLPPRRFLPSLSLLAAFEAASRTGSVTAAARELGLTQGAVSRQILALEEQLGVALFLRERQTIRLTRAGRVMRGKSGRPCGEYRPRRSICAPIRMAARSISVFCQALVRAGWCRVFPISSPDIRAFRSIFLRVRRCSIFELIQSMRRYISVCRIGRVPNSFF